MLNHLENLPRILKPVHKSKKRLNHVQPWKEVSKKSQTTAKANYLQKKSKALKNTMGVYTLKTSNFCGDETIPAIYPSYGVKLPRLQCTGLLSGRFGGDPGGSGGHTAAAAAAASSSVGGSGGQGSTSGKGASRASWDGNW